MSIPHILQHQLKQLNPDSNYTGSLPRIRSSSGKLYYGKIGESNDYEQWTGEVESLRAMHLAAPGLSPKVLAFGLDNGKPYFISEYKDISYLSDTAAQTLSKRLATELHQYSGSKKKFGFHVPTYCGATRLNNGWFDTWAECYSSMLGDLVSQLRSKSAHYGELCDMADSVINNVIPKLLGPLDIKPVLLHGDLWSGNAGVDKETGQPVIYDPASYYGHNEADLAIARIFGGFSHSFFETYHMHHPKTEPVEEYELRADLYELFHYLNHTLLFGGSYASSAKRKMHNLLH